MSHIKVVARGCVVPMLTGVLLGCATPPTSSVRAASPQEHPPTATAGAHALDAVRWANIAWDHRDAKVPVTPEDAIWGSPLAPVTAVVFLDFECPFSAKMQMVLAELRKTFGPEQLRIAVKHLPMPFHAQAAPAALAAETVRALASNDGFWVFHDLAFGNSRELSASAIEAWAAQAGVSPERLRQGMKNPLRAAHLQEDTALAEHLGVRGTPTTFINGIRLSGLQRLDEVVRLVEEQGQAANLLMRQHGVPAASVYTEATAQNYEEPEALPSDEPAADDTVWQVPVQGSPARGPSDALVTVVVFSDFECPFCARAEDTIRALLDRYPQDVRIVWKDLPLPFHPRARAAALFAREARRQRGDTGFWEAHDKLFSSGALEQADLERHATDLRLNVAMVRRALDKETHGDAIGEDEDLAERLQAQGTPHFFVNGRRIAGAQPLEIFDELVQEELAKARDLVQGGTARAKVYGALQRDATPAPELPMPERVAMPAPTAEQPWKGGRTAKVVIQQFSDFQCPYCARVEDTLAAVQKKYGDRVKIVWRNLPLPMHADARLAAEACLEVHRQKGNAGFWAFHQKLFEHQLEDGGLARPALESYAAKLGVQMDRFRRALDQGEHRSAVDDDTLVADRAGLRGTPTFVVNGYLIAGAQPIRTFERVVDLALREAR